MSTRAILNKSSQKKRDTMLSFTDVTAANPESGVFAQASAVMAGASASFFTFGWIPTARQAEDSTGAKGAKIDTATRTSHTIFARGVKENIILSTNSGASWEWRRICFTLKGSDYIDTVDPTTSDYFRLTSNGYVRLVTEIPDQDIFIPMFRGARDQDWIDPLNAAVNTDLASIHFDKKRTIASGNERGIIRSFKMWHPMNKNIVYRDEEDGDTMFTSALSTSGRKGMGDYYIIDMFRCNNADTADTLEFLPQATFYWHEK